MKYILSIDGGGIKGIIPALVLAELERRSGRSIATLFDLVAGSSTGGMLALGLTADDGRGSARYRAANLVELYAGQGEMIFSHDPAKDISSMGGLRDEQYSHAGLEAIFSGFFADAPLSSLLGRVMVTSYDIERRQACFMKNWHPQWASMEIRHAARATSAAPSIFEPARVPVNGEMRAMIDGGVFLNTPAMSAYVEMKRLFPEEEVLLLSLGTGKMSRPIPYAYAKDLGRADWLMPVLGCTNDGMASVVDYQLGQLLGEHYIRFQPHLEQASDEMDDVSRANIDNLIAESGRLIAGQEAVLERLCRLLTDG